MKRALVCPLNWGLGHATRCVPIINQLLADGYQVTIAADGYPLVFLQQQFPTLQTIELPSYPIRYANAKTQVWAMLIQLPAIIQAIYNEHQWLKKKLSTEHFDLVVSDNRFGLWTTKTECHYITHQLMIKMPRGLKLFEPIAWWIHRQFINRYSTCLIPDFATNTHKLSGDLAHRYPMPKNARFIGPLSRFKNINTVDLLSTYDVVCLVSGVEPQRSLFENTLIDRFANSMERVLIVRGKPSNTIQHSHQGTIQLVNHLQNEELAAYLIASKKIITRSGYSSIMDLYTLNCLSKCEFIPTPGQTEQEYLYHLYSESNKNRFI